MKESRIFILLLCFTVNLFSQEEKTTVVIINGNESKSIGESKSIQFNFKGHARFLHLKNVHSKKHVGFEKIKSKIIDVSEFRKNILFKLKEPDGGLVTFYKDAEATIYIYLRNMKCFNEGILYEVNYLAFLDKEVN